MRLTLIRLAGDAWLDEVQYWLVCNDWAVISRVAQQVILRVVFSGIGGGAVPKGLVRLNGQPPERLAQASFTSEVSLSFRKPS